MHIFFLELPNSGSCTQFQPWHPDLKYEKGVHIPVENRCYKRKQSVCECEAGKLEMARLELLSGIIERKGKTKAYMTEI